MWKNRLIYLLTLLGVEMIHESVRKEIFFVIHTKVVQIKAQKENSICYIKFLSEMFSFYFFNNPKLHEKL